MNEDNLMKLASSSKHIWRLLNYLDENVQAATIIVHRLNVINVKYNAVIFENEENSMIFFKKTYFLPQSLSIVELMVHLNGGLEELSEQNIRITREYAHCIPRNVKGLMFLETLLWNLDKALNVES